MKQYFILKRAISQGVERLPKASVIYILDGIQPNRRQLLFEELSLK